MLAPFGGRNYDLGALDQRFGRRLGFNRETWNLGRQVGRSLKRKFQEIKSESKAKRVKREFKSAPTIGVQLPTGGGDSMSRFFLKRNNTTKIGKLELVPQVIINNSALRTESQIGQQNAVLIGDYYTNLDVNLHFALANTSNSAKVLLKSVHGESLITNQENVNARITIYDIMSRRDGAAGASDPYVAFRDGFLDSTNGAAGDFVVPGATPFSNPRFVEWFKVLKTTNVILSPGACHSHVVDYKINKLYSHEVTNLTTSSCLAGVTLFTMIIYHGSPINDITTQTQVSLSHIALDVVQKESYHFAYAAVNNAVSDINQGLPLSFTVAGATMQDDGVELPANEA